MNCTGWLVHLSSNGSKLFNTLDNCVTEWAVDVEQVYGLTPAVVVNGGCVWLAFRCGMDDVAVDGFDHGWSPWWVGRGSDRLCELYRMVRLWERLL